MVIFLLSATRKAFKRQKTLTNLNKSLSKTKMSRLHLEDASTYWSQSFGKETTITWDRYDLVTAITMWSYDLCTRMDLIRFNYILYEILMDNLTECKWFWELTYNQVLLMINRNGCIHVWLGADVCTDFNALRKIILLKKWDNGDWYSDLLLALEEYESYF